MDEELKKLMKEMTEEAKKVREDYIKNPSEESGSQIHIHENSPFLTDVGVDIGTRKHKNIKIEPNTEE